MNTNACFSETQLVKGWPVNQCPNITVQSERVDLERMRIDAQMERINVGLFRYKTMDCHYV